MNAVLCTQFYLGELKIGIWELFQICARYQIESAVADGCVMFFDGRQIRLAFECLSKEAAELQQPSGYLGKLQTERSISALRQSQSLNPFSTEDINIVPHLPLFANTNHIISVLW